MYRSGGKRALDIAASALVGLVTLPLMLAVALLVRVKLGAPVFFRQERPGRDGRTFRILKFRTMTDARGPDGALLPDGQRLTRFGRFLRSTSLDEMPEVWNVLKGEMSLVGPRPLLVAYLDRYTPEQARRHEVRPGITGLAQVSGRNNAGWPAKLALDVWYVDNYSLGVDLRVLWRTLTTVVRRQDVSEDGHATAREFAGEGGERQ